jgi:multidrug resistance efflux pump
LSQHQADGYGQIVRGHVGSIARGVNVGTARPARARRGKPQSSPGVRLAQRIPVRIHIDQVPEGVRLVVGMTGTVQIDPPLLQPVATR